ncbi:hypothetical protein OIO90_001989 [Microbotryomycetes sp. JL221]|nr:hypothetical protein OIO90_001989 [Microbotryomycetes sp. JL221]
MKVLVLGASGFLGSEICAAFIRNGHTVVGATRSADKTKQLEANEVISLVADPADPKTWEHVVADVDCVIDAIGGATIKEIGNTVLETVKREAAKSRPQGPPLSFIYTGGTWLHGDDHDPPFGSLSDLSPITKPNAVTAWRKEHEIAVLGAKSVSLAPNVVRPSLLYGRSGSITASWMETAHEGHVKVAGKSDARLATCHVDDAASMFVLVAEKALIVQGVVFDASNPYPESLAFILERLAHVAKAKGPTFSKPTNDFERAITSTDILRPTLGKTLLGWEAKRPPLAEGMETYYKAFLASVA